MTSLELFVAISLLGAVSGTLLAPVGLILTCLQWRRLGWTLHAIGIIALALSALIAAALQAAFHATRYVVALDLTVGVLFVAWAVLAARAAYRSPVLPRPV